MKVACCWPKVSPYAVCSLRPNELIKTVSCHSWRKHFLEEHSVKYIWVHSDCAWRKTHEMFLASHVSLWKQLILKENPQLLITILFQLLLPRRKSSKTAKDTQVVSLFLILNVHPIFFSCCLFSRHSKYFVFASIKISEARRNQWSTEVTPLRMNKCVLFLRKHWNILDLYLARSFVQRTTTVIIHSFLPDQQNSRFVNYHLLW